jgi:hypothetical protein
MAVQFSTPRTHDYGTPLPISVAQETLPIILNFGPFFVRFWSAIAVPVVIFDAVILAGLAVVFVDKKERLILAIDTSLLLFKKKIWFHFLSS